MKNFNILIERYLKKRKERVIVDLTIRDYNKRNFYIALVFNRNIEKFKVLFVPLDVCTYNHFEEYVCFQFVNIVLVNHILNTINENDYLFSDPEFRDKRNKHISNYYLEINTHVNKKDYKFMTNRYLPKEWEPFFEIIIILFENLPKSMDSLCDDLLGVLNDAVVAIDYRYSVDFDLFKDDLGKLLFEKEQKIREVSFLEHIGDMYFGIVDGALVIAEYDNYAKILNLYCEVENDDSYFYNFLVAIRNEKFKKFYKLLVVEDKSYFEKKLGNKYLCCGVEDKKLLGVCGSKREKIDINLYKKGLIKITDDDEDILKKEIKEALKK